MRKERAPDKSPHSPMRPRGEHATLTKLIVYAIAFKTIQIMQTWCVFRTATHRDCRFVIACERICVRRAIDHTRKRRSNRPASTFTTCVIIKYIKSNKVNAFTMIYFSIIITKRDHGRWSKYARGPGTRAATRCCCTIKWDFMVRSLNANSGDHCPSALNATTNVEIVYISWIER